jgi:glycerol-3-phosphate dehydrogenase
VNRAASLAQLPITPALTSDLRLHGFDLASERFGRFAPYGSDAPAILALIENDPVLGRPLHAKLPYCPAEILWAVRFEMARTVEDVLARRTRALFLNARAAVECAPQVAVLMARELGKPEGWQNTQIEGFRQLAANYMVERT